MTNAWHIAKELDKRCDGSHVHQALLGGSRASNAAVYPEELCKAMCRGLLKEKKMRKGNTVPLMRLSGMHIRRPLLTKSDTMHEKDVSKGFASRVSPDIVTGGNVNKVGQHERNRKQRICLLQQKDGNWKAFDDITGLELDSNKVYEARIKEITFIDTKMVWVKIPRSEAKKNGWKIVKGRWIDINKGDDIHPLLRSRYVGKEFNDGPVEGLFAGTPPLEALRSIVSEAATVEGAESEEKVIHLDDVSRAFFEAKATRQVCVELPEEALTLEEKALDLVGLLKMSLYGTRDAATNWQEEIAKFMKAENFVRGNTIHVYIGIQITMLRYWCMRTILLALEKEDI